MDKVKSPLGRVFIHMTLVLFAIYSMVPFVWTLLQSLKTFKDAYSRTPRLFFTPTWANYQEIWLRSVPENGALIGFFLAATVIVLICVLLFAEHIPVPNSLLYILVALGFAAMIWGIPLFIDTSKFYDYFHNTVIVTVGTIVVSISVGCLAGYALARYTGIAAVIILLAALGFRSLPRLAFILPYFWIGTTFNLIDSHLLVILTLVAVNQPFTIWMLRSFFRDVPKEMEESAMIDGASRFTAFRKVIVPMVWPGIVSTSLFTLLLAYNEFLLVRILTQSNWTLPVAISRFTGGEQPDHITLAAAASISATIPIILVILFFQKQLVKGLAAGAVKG